MKKLFAALKRAPKRVATLAVVAAAIAVPAGLYAWGPDRPTYTIENPANHVTFNSITNNPNYGDERNFVTVKDPATGNYVDTVNVEQGKEYQVRVLVHNNAADNLDLVAMNTTLKTAITNTVGKQNAITSYVSADNAQPQTVYDDAFFKSEKDFNLTYVAGSVRAYNNGYAAGGQGQPLSDNLFTQAGVKLGYEQDGDGKIPGCFKYINYVYFKVKPQFVPTPDFTVAKAVSKHGENKWNENIAAQPGETVDYRIQYRNTGDVQQDDVVVKDQLPEHMSYVPGTSKLYNSQHPNGFQLSDGVVTDQGVNIGSHAPGGVSYVVFQAKAASADELECGVNTLTNKASVTTDYGSKDDTADVTVPKECQPEEIVVCDLETNEIVRINEDEFNPERYSRNLEDCKEVPSQIIVCDLTTNEIVTIDEAAFDSSKHSTNLEDCAPTPEENCPIPGKEHLPMDSPDCVEPTTPVTPTELPQTGSSDGVLTMAGLATLALVLGYAVTARRTLG